MCSAPKALFKMRRNRFENTQLNAALPVCMLTVMEKSGRFSFANLNSAQAYHEPSSQEVAEYLIRAPTNPLQEDPDSDEKIIYRITPGGQITNDQLETCAKHYSRYHGVWGKEASKFGIQPGKLALKSMAISGG